MNTKQSKTMYSVSNLEGTYDDLTIWFNEMLAGNKKTIEKHELIQFLASKNRVPLAILKKNKTPRKSNDQCCARNLKEFTQCKNESSGSKSMFCKVHTTHPPKWTMDDKICDIELFLNSEKENKIRIVKEVKAAKKEAKKEAKKAAKKAAKLAEEDITSDDDNLDTDSTESDEIENKCGESSDDNSVKHERLVDLGVPRRGRKKMVAKKALIEVDSFSDIDFN
jgi:ribosomal protein L7/L12